MLSRYSVIIAALAMACDGIVACGKEKPVPEPEPGDQARFNELADHLPEFLDQGFVVVRDGAGAPKHQGDALWRTGLALYALDCTRGAQLKPGLFKMFDDLNGGIYRHPSLPNRASMDGLLTLYQGIVHRIDDCGEEGEWRPYLARHAAFMAATEDLLNPGDTAYLPPFFPYLREKLLEHVGLPAAPQQGPELQAEVAAWAQGVETTHGACYRAFLGLVTLETMEALGDSIHATWRNLYCSATDTMGLPVVDHWCGRGSLARWLDEFVVDQYDFRHQRCVWEAGPDCIGDHCLGVDYLYGWVRQHGKAAG